MLLGRTKDIETDASVSPKIGSLKCPKGYFTKVLVLIESSLIVEDFTIIDESNVPIMAFAGSISKPTSSEGSQPLNIKRPINSVNKSNLNNFISTLLFKLKKRVLRLQFLRKGCKNFRNLR